MSDLRDPTYTERYLEQNPTAQQTVTVANQILASTGGCIDKFLANIAPELRKAVDEVIDMPRSKRFSMNQLEKTEKTYIGTKVEILLKAKFNWQRGTKLDTHIGDFEVDIKNTIGSSWMIPKEAVNQYCLLIQIDDKKGIFSAGVVLCSPENISAGENQDKKRSISPGKPAIFWLGRKTKMEANFFDTLPIGVCESLVDPNISGMERIRRLCKLVPNRALPRRIIECVAQQKDPLKRLRANGGVRKELEKEDILVLSGKYDQQTLVKYGFSNVAKDEFVAVHTRGLEKH